MCRFHCPPIRVMLRRGPEPRAARLDLLLLRRSPESRQAAEGIRAGTHVNDARDLSAPQSSGSNGCGQKSDGGTNQGGSATLPVPSSTSYYLLLTYDSYVCTLIRLVTEGDGMGENVDPENPPLDAPSHRADPLAVDSMDDPSGILRYLLSLPDLPDSDPEPEPTVAELLEEAATPGGPDRIAAEARRRDPGPMTAQMLTTINPRKLGPAGLLDAVCAAERLASWIQATSTATSLRSLGPELRRRWTRSPTTPMPLGSRSIVCPARSLRSDLTMAIKWHQALRTMGNPVSTGPHWPASRTRWRLPRCRLLSWSHP